MHIWRFTSVAVCLLVWLFDAAPGQSEEADFMEIATIAGNGSTGPPSPQGTALEVSISNPFGVQPEADGSLILASLDQHVVYRLDPTYQQIQVIAGTGKAGLSGADGDNPTQVSLDQPHEVQVDSTGNIYIADTRNHRVGMIDARTGRWKNIAGTGAKGFSGDRGPAAQATLNQAYSIAVDQHELFIADLGNHRIRRVDLRSGTIDTVCGTGKNALPTDGEPAVEQPLADPRSIAADKDNLWIVLRGGNSVWRMNRSNGRIYHVAGTGDQGSTGDGGDAIKATFRGPKGIAVDPDVAVYIADTENHAIRRIDLATGKIKSIVGVIGTPGYNGDGDQVDTRLLRRPHGVCRLPSGILLIGDSEIHRLRIVTP